MDRTTLATRANDAARASRRGGSPVLSHASSAETNAAWLQWNDPNGSHIAALAIQDGFDPYTVDAAWTALEEQLSHDSQ